MVVGKCGSTVNAEFLIKSGGVVSAWNWSPGMTHLGGRQFGAKSRGLARGRLRPVVDRVRKNCLRGFHPSNPSPCVRQPANEVPPDSLRTSEPRSLIPSACNDR